jgi:hypothetical protein
MLDVGSGPGLLGLACAASKGLRKTVLSECEQKGEDGGETGALPLLRRNVDRYNGALGGDQGEQASSFLSSRPPHVLLLTPSSRLSLVAAGGAKAKAVALDWLAPREAYEGEFDFVTGSDVIFNEALSRPLLETLSLYTKSKKRVRLTRTHNPNHASLHYSPLPLRSLRSHRAAFATCAARSGARPRTTR